MTFDSIDLLLLALGSLFFVVLWIIEWYCGFKGIPTISARIQRFSRAAPFAVVFVAWLIGYLMAHFFLACG